MFLKKFRIMFCLSEPKSVSAKNVACACKRENIQRNNVSSTMFSLLHEPKLVVAKLSQKLSISISRTCNASNLC